MWLATIYGFFSVVCAHKDGGKSAEINPNLLMIRARRKEHLQSLRERFPKQLDACEISETRNTDYRWRIICPKQVWAGCVKELVEEQTYPNFKSACEEPFGHQNPYPHALHRIWSVMHEMQNTTR